MESQSPFARAALQGELERVRSATPGGIKVAAYGASKSLGQLVGAGLLDEEPVREALMEAAQAAGLTEREAREHIRRGLRKGVSQPRPVRARCGLAPGAISAQRPPSSSSRPQPAYMPEARAQHFWRRCGVLTEDEVTSAYLAERSIDPESVALWDLGRALLPGTTAPWAVYKRAPWHASGHRLVLPMWDDRGRMAGFRARRTGEGDTPKDLSAAGFAATGLVFACPLAQQLLAAGRPPAWWGGRPFTLRIVEGSPDFLLMASRAGDSTEYGPAVLGVMSGSWNDALARRIPDGSRVLLAGHDDVAGQGYMLRIGNSLRCRCDVRVFRAKGA